MSKRNIIRIGDTVKILRPKFISRVGYPLTKRDLLGEVESDPIFNQMAESLGFHGRSRSAFLDGIAGAELLKRGMGGKERSLHYLEVREGAEAWNDYSTYAVGRTSPVYSKRTVVTGEYYAPAGGTSWTDCGREDWYEPGGLSNQKVHLLLQTDFGEIEACDVEKAA